MPINEIKYICFDKKNYEDDSDMWFDIMQLLTILSKNYYISVVHPEDCNLVHIYFESAKTDLGAPYPVWLTPEQEEALQLVLEDEDVSEE